MREGQIQGFIRVRRRRSGQVMDVIMINVDPVAVYSPKWVFFVVIMNGRIPDNAFGKQKYADMMQISHESLIKSVKSLVEVRGEG